MNAFKNMLVDIPDSDSSPDCIDLVRQLALNETARMTLTTILPSFTDLFSIIDADDMREELQGSLEKQAAAALKTLADYMQESGISCDTVVGKSSRKAKKLIARVLKHEHDLIVKDALVDHRGERAVCGALDQKLVRHSPCPVWLLRAGSDRLPGGKVVIAVDAVLDEPIHRELNIRLVRYGKALAKVYRTDLHILHAWNFDGGDWLKGSVGQEKYLGFRSSAKKAVSQKLDQFLAAVDIQKNDATLHLLEGSADKVISAYCDTNPVCSLVIGTVGRAGLAGYLIGNTAERVMNTVECSVLVVNPKQIQSPVELKLLEEFDEMDGPSLAY